MPRSTICHGSSSWWRTSRYPHTIRPSEVKLPIRLDDVKLHRDAHDPLPTIGHGALTRGRCPGADLHIVVDHVVAQEDLAAARDELWLPAALDERAHRLQVAGVASIQIRKVPRVDLGVVSLAQ